MPKRMNYCPVRTLDDLTARKQFILSQLILGKSEKDIVGQFVNGAELDKDYIDKAIILMHKEIGLPRPTKLSRDAPSAFYGPIIQWAADQGMTRNAVLTGVLEKVAAPVLVEHVELTPLPEPQFEPVPLTREEVKAKRIKALEAQRLRLDVKRKARRQAWLKREAKRQELRVISAEAMKKTKEEKAAEIEKRRRLPTWSKDYLPPGS